jgi:hypothetical protein
VEITPTLRPEDIILPHERWYADKWVVSKGIFDVKTARISNSVRSFFQ